MRKAQLDACQRSRERCGARATTGGPATPEVRSWRGQFREIGMEFLIGVVVGGLLFGGRGGSSHRGFDIGSNLHAYFSSGRGSIEVGII